MSKINSENEKIKEALKLIEENKKKIALEEKIRNMVLDSQRGTPGYQYE